MIYGYCRIRTREQSIERQIRNIKGIYPDATIVQEVFTGTKVEGRDKWNNLLRKVKKDDTIVFDSVSRMSRNSEDGFELYEELFNRGVELKLIKEPHINTSTYKKALTGGIELTGTTVDLILDGV